VEALGMKTKTLLALLSIASIALAVVVYLWSGPVQKQAGKTVFEVYYSPLCSCCKEYIRYLRASGVEVIAKPTEDMQAVKERFNIPRQLWSCHTSIVEGYFVEGHVPLEVVRKLLDMRPVVDGIALPGMPAGSPGMDGVKTEPFTIYSSKNGVVSLFIRL
jgi:hypothetical protein